MTNSNALTTYFKDLSRKDYIALASDIIKEEGIEGVSIRRIARELGCSSASLYRHFENLNELLYYAQLDALNEYIINLSQASKEWSGIWDTHFGIWECYAQIAFKNPEAFEHIFFKNLHKNSEEALKEYYEMFPEMIVDIEPKTQKMLRTSNYYERDLQICLQLVDEGKIAPESAEKLNHIICNLFLGYFKYRQSYSENVESNEQLVQQFLAEAKEIASLYTIEN